MYVMECGGRGCGGRGCGGIWREGMWREKDGVEGGWGMEEEGCGGDGCGGREGGEEGVTFMQFV